MERILTKFCKGQATIVGERRNASCFVIFKINHFQKNKHRKENNLIFSIFHENAAL